jgi:hypothetical protein
MSSCGFVAKTRPVTVRAGIQWKMENAIGLVRRAYHCDNSLKNVGRTAAKASVAKILMRDIGIPIVHTGREKTATALLDFPQGRAVPAELPMIEDGFVGPWLRRTGVVVGFDPKAEEAPRARDRRQDLHDMLNVRDIIVDFDDGVSD